MKTCRILYASAADILELLYIIYIYDVYSD